jgi:hypothetical protein
VLFSGSPVAATAQGVEPTDSLAPAPMVGNVPASVPSVARGHNYFFVKGRDYGTDAYGGPFDLILNKGFAVAQWQDQDRHIFSYPYGWNAVWASVTNPGPAIERAGGWGTVLRRHVLPLDWDEFVDAQWMPNYFGHVLEGGLAYRRLLEWNRMHGTPFPTLSSVIVTQFAVTINEAYETPVDDPWVQENGTAGAFVDWWIMDPLGMVLMHQDPVAGFFANKLGAVIWPRQASITFPGGRLTNNGEAVIPRWGRRRGGHLGSVRRRHDQRRRRRQLERPEAQRGARRRGHVQLLLRDMDRPRRLAALQRDLGPQDRSASRHRRLSGRDLDRRLDDRHLVPAGSEMASVFRHHGAAYAGRGHRGRILTDHGITPQAP